MLKLGTIVTDSVTNRKGMLTIYNVDMAHNELYVFQPSGLNPKTKKPLETSWINPARIVGGIEVVSDLPLEVLGTKVEDKATGFKGTVTAIDRHINGCVHLDIKSPEIIEETGESVDLINLDIRRLRGEAIVELDGDILEQNRKDNPSPEHKPNFNRK
jgi:hypothetical protein